MSSNERVIIGIDPGLAATGWGVIVSTGRDYRHLAHGTIRTAASSSIGERLSHIYCQLREVVQKYRPESAGVESLYFARNVTSAIPVAQARGVLLLLLHEQGVSCTEYPPQFIKRIIADDGRATKEQVREMVGLLLQDNVLPAMSTHAVDAIAAALCYCHNRLPQLA